MAAALKYIMVVCEDREYWLRGSDFTATEPGEDGTFTVDLLLRNRRVGQFSHCTGVYISTVPDVDITRLEKPESSSVPAFITDWE